MSEEKQEQGLKDAIEKGKKRMMNVIGSIGKGRRTKKTTEKIAKKVDKVLTDLTAELFAKVEDKMDAKIIEKVEDLHLLNNRADNLGQEKVEPYVEKPTKNYELTCFVCFKVSGPDFYDANNIDWVNEFLQKFRRQLESLRIQEGNMKISPIRVDDFAAKMFGSVLHCRQKILYNVWDQESGSAVNHNNHLRPLVTRNLEKIKLKELGSADRPALSVKVIDTAYDNPPMFGDSHWPPERAITVSMI